MPVEDLRQSPMMEHMLEALAREEDIGHYGQLTFVMIARDFLDSDELVELVQQVQEKGYSPLRRDKVLEWQSEQDLQICPNPDDPNACNVYNDLRLPEEVYEDIQKYREDQQAAGS